MKKTICIICLLFTFMFSATAVQLNTEFVTEEEQGFQSAGLKEAAPLCNNDLQTETIISEINPRLLEKRTLLSHYEIQTGLNNGYYQQFYESFTGDKIKTGTLVFNVALSCTKPNATVKAGFGYLDANKGTFVYDTYDYMELGKINYMNCGKRPSYNTYTGCMTNDTGGTLTGNIWLYSVDGYM